MSEIDALFRPNGSAPVVCETGDEASAVSVVSVAVIPYRLPVVEPVLEDRYISRLPSVLQKAATADFDNLHHRPVDDFAWVALSARDLVRKVMFVAQVVAKSEEPAIPDHSWCLVKIPVEGECQGVIVLVQLRTATELETTQQHTVKRYKGERRNDSSRRPKITLNTMNRDFAHTVLTGADQGDSRVVAELIDVLERKAHSVATDSQ